MSRTRKRLEGPARRAAVKRLIERDGNLCVYCLTPFTNNLPPTVDHVIPLAACGSNDDNNLVLACAPCNNIKKDGGLPRKHVRTGGDT